MAGVKLNLRLSASSIVEVLIAMILIVVVFSIAMAIFANVQRLSLSGKKVHAQAVLKEQLFKAAQAPVVSKQEVVIDGLNIEQEISAYQDRKNLYEVSLKAYDANRGESIAELKEVIYANK